MRPIYLFFLGFIILTTFSSSCLSKNQMISSFAKAKKLLHKKVYFDRRKSLYCNANYNEISSVEFPAGFYNDRYIKRSKKIEWEHVVPAENFGKLFSEWTEGHFKCLTKNGNQYKGRKCANKMNEDFKYMAADLYNLFPTIGSVNALRSNYDFDILDSNIRSDFGSCDMRIDSKKAQPPEQSRGRIARAYLYMENTYNLYEMTTPQRNLMISWDKEYPVSPWECIRAQRIKEIQGNSHFIYEKKC